MAKLTGKAARAVRALLHHDNHILGFVICGFATYDWMRFYDNIDDLRTYLTQGIYTLPLLPALNTVFSALYLTFASVVLICLKPPKARYDTIAPNLLSIASAFMAYLYILLPVGDLFPISIYISLALVVIGSALVLVSFVALRQAFTVTPQARFLVARGPYGLVRHPMYTGNIITMLGLATLNNSATGYGLFACCAAMQIARALFEERLLLANLPAYADYRAEVGGFLPRIRAETPIKVTAYLCLGLMCLAGHTFPTVARAMPMPRKTANIPMVTFIGLSDADLQKRCASWMDKANNNIWFTEKDQSLYDSESDRIGKLSGCQPINDLAENKCLPIAKSWMMGEMKPKSFLKKVEDSGCRTIVGFESYCDALRDAAKMGIVLSEDRRATMQDCLIADLTKKRSQLLRPMM